MTKDQIWIAVGLAGQFLFLMRLLVQWISSERQRQSVIPIAFWYFSLGGGVILLSYALYREDIVFITGQSIGLIIYSRNLYLIKESKRRNIPPLTEDK